MADAVKADWRNAPLDSATKTLLAYAEKLTRAPASVTSAGIDDLRHAGFSDEAIHDATQVIAYFNYINRVADGLGVDLEEWMPNKPNGASGRDEPGTTGE